MGRGGQNLENAAAPLRAGQAPQPRVVETRNEDGDVVQITVYGAGDEKAIEQIANCLRVGSARGGALMADHHVGYSQPIGGVVAYEHHISPSGVGYDIACLAAGSPVLSAHGYHRPIEETLPTDASVCADHGDIRPLEGSLGAIARGTKPVIDLDLVNGRRLRLTADHEILTPQGWRQAGELGADDFVACPIFRGLPYERPAESTVRLELPADASEHARKTLEELGLWPLRTDDQRLPMLLRLFGFACGDGHLHKDGKALTIYTSIREDAEEIRRDLESLGFRASLYHRVRASGSDENAVKVTSIALVALFEAMGMPKGKKVHGWKREPMPWLFALPAWLRAQYLAGFAAAEASSPAIAGSGLRQIMIKQSGSTDHAIRHVQVVLQSLGFDTHVSVSGPARRDADGAEITCWACTLRGGAAEIVRFYETVGFAYAREKTREAATVLSQYWNRLDGVRPRLAAYRHARMRRAARERPRDIVRAVSGAFGISEHFVRHAIYSDRGLPRRSPACNATPSSTRELAWVRVRSVSDPGVEVPVYDIATADPAHCFIADGIVVHNCGIKGVRTSLKAPDVAGSMPQIMDEVVRRISFGLGRPNSEPVDHPVFDEIANAAFEPQRELLELARSQLGTVGSGNHFVELCRDEADDSVWVVTHFGSRGFGHKTASGFLAMAQGLGFDEHATEGEMFSPPVLFDTRTDLGQAYVEAMQLAGRYAYAGRDVVCDKVLEILGAEETRSVHLHHNFAWQEEHGGRKLWVVRKGATPAFPGQQGVVGGSMEYGAVVLEGQDSAEGERSLNSTVHGAGRVMSRRKAAGKVKYRRFYACGVRDCAYEIPARDYRQGHSACPRHPDAGLHRREESRVVREGAVNWEAVRRRLSTKGIVLRGGAADEAPEVYKALDDVLAAHGDQIRVRHRLIPLGVAMAGREIKDPYKD